MGHAAIWTTALLLVCGTVRGFAATPQDILQQTHTDGGFVVVLGGNGALAEGMRPNDRYTVVMFSRDPQTVSDVRSHLAAEGKYGFVSADRLAGDVLPLTDNLVNLIVIADDEGIAEDELLRVLAPGGAIYRLADGSIVSKPWPDDLDQWSHFLHDAGNNAVANDDEVGPPRAVQWVAPPLWLRSHETPSGIEGMVSAGGRLYYIFDEGLIGITDKRLPERWSLICRDAFNGKLLWKRPLESWGWPEWAPERADVDWLEARAFRTVVPEENQRRVVATEDRLYATLAYRAPLSILDPATGEVLKTVPETNPVREILYEDDIVVVHSANANESSQAGSILFGLSPDGDILWKKETPGIRSLMLAADDGRVVYFTQGALSAIDLATGKSLWSTPGIKGNGKTLIAAEGEVFWFDGGKLAVFDATTGDKLWEKSVPRSGGAESVDLFVIDGLVWRGMVPVDENGRPVGKSENAMAVGYDIRTGEEKKRVLVRKLRSPEHHHRCYRNKATERFIISGMEGAEFMDLVDGEHSQNNFLRGACKLGIMPANGLMYVPADQCFCQPGSKLLGFVATTDDTDFRSQRVPDDRRLERGPAYGTKALQAKEVGPGDWPTYRHDPARHGYTPAEVKKDVVPAWRTKLGTKLTQPVVAGGRVYIADIDAHTVFALDASDGQPIWKFVAGGRIDSPPTVYRGAVLFGSADGWVYCLRAEDGALAWRFLAAPADCRVAVFDQLESVWPVHGSVLVENGTAYVAAGRSTYLDGGVQLWALDPLTGEIRHQTVLAGPFPKVGETRDMGFFLEGANVEVLVAEGGYVYMRQKKLTRDLKPIESEILSSKGEKDVGLHVFSTGTLLDGSWYNRAFWMYSKRWPGFQLANQAPKAGQLLVVDPERTFAVRVYYYRNVHSPMFFPGREGYLLFADRNDNEPQIVGEPGARKPVEWLPQSYIPRDGGKRPLDSEAFGLDKMIGYTRAEPPLWKTWIPVRIRGMVKAGDLIFAAGPPDVFDPNDPYAPFEGRKGAKLVAVTADDGRVVHELSLEAEPVFDGLIAADGALFMSLRDGSLACLRAKTSP
ncbi:outer membrane protein assembly factor BamB family protein [Thermostilla marina]